VQERRSISLDTFEKIDNLALRNDKEIVDRSLKVFRLHLPTYEIFTIPEILLAQRVGRSCSRNPRNDLFDKFPTSTKALQGKLSRPTALVPA
jgi:hypothetical protein